MGATAATKGKRGHKNPVFYFDLWECVVDYRALKCI